MSPVGIRNNNPGNIRSSKVAWQGQTGASPLGFCIFDTPANGLRALCKQLLTDEVVHGCRTVQEIITRWAPPKENNTKAYIKDVSDRMKISPIDDINLRKPAVLASLATAIIWHENAEQPYAPSLIAGAVDNALKGLK